MEYADKNLLTSHKRAWPQDDRHPDSERLRSAKSLVKMSDTIWTRMHDDPQVINGCAFLLGLDPPKLPEGWEEVQTKPTVSLLLLLASSRFDPETKEAQGKAS